MKEIKTSVLIDAPVSKVWQVLSEFEAYGRWNPFLRSISGSAVVGGVLKVVIQVPKGSSMVFKPKVLRFEAEREFRWLGVLGVSGVFDGEHYFILRDLGGGVTEVFHGEIFRGILVGVFEKMGMLRNTVFGFELMNEALKKECEK
jgi:hypothetical protein